MSFHQSFPRYNKTLQLMWDFFMYTVYVLFSRKYDKIYIGYTSNLERRLISHNELGTKGWTKRFRPWELVYKEEYKSKSEAMQREKELKGYRGKEFIRGLLAGKK